MLYQVNATSTLDPIRETHYRFHHKIDPSQFPQVHDFYEITLVTEGMMAMEINGVSEMAAEGPLMLIRPGDIHSRRAEESCSYINLAFPPRTVLSSGEAVLFKAQLEKLNLLPVDRPHVVGMELCRLPLI